eukprot:SAG11_NODE_5692_length_1485_cov_6.056818_1_plen_79_part_00
MVEEMGSIEIDDENPVSSDSAAAQRVEGVFGSSGDTGDVYFDEEVMRDAGEGDAHWEGISSPADEVADLLTRMRSEAS